MADLGFGDSGYDANAPENNQANVIPKADYRAVIVKSDKVATKDGKGFRLTLQFQILEGEFKNKIIFEGLNLWLAETDDKKREAVKIAKGQFSELCRAVNVINPRDSAQLHDLPVTIKVGIQEAKGDFPARNKVTGYKPASRAEMQPTLPAQPAAPVGAVNSAASPWG